MPYFILLSESTIKAGRNFIAEPMKNVKNYLKNNIFYFKIHFLMILYTYITIAMRSDRMSEENRFNVNLHGMVYILANHICNPSGVFIRELPLNGTYAISARRLYEKSFKNGKITAGPKIIDGKKTVIFGDNGIGLSYDEINGFLAVIGQSSKRDIMTGRISEEYTGRFGTGLLLCFMITDKMQMTTHSAKSGEYLERTGTPDGVYSINRIDYCPGGTAYYVKLNEDSHGHFDTERIDGLVRYCGLPLPFTVMLKTGSGTHGINTVVYYNSNMQNSIMKFRYNTFHEFSRRKRYGYSLRPYDRHLHRFENNIDKKTVERAYRQFVISQRDFMSDRYDCEMNTRAKYEHMRTLARVSGVK